MTDSSKQPLPVLLIASRDPRGELTGRKTVLQSTISALSGLGCRVQVAYFDRPAGGAAAGDPNVLYVQLPLPGRLELVARIVAGFGSGRRSLNECLYASGRARRTLARVAKDQNIEVVVTDMVRTADFGRDLDLPWIADLDDLLSLRYERLNEEGRRAKWPRFLGSMGSPFLLFLARLGQPFSRHVLRREARILAHREVEVAREADVVSTMSPREAAELAARSGVEVRTTPIVVEARPSSASTDTPLHERGRELVFLGSLDYFPNQESVAEFDRAIAPALAARGVADPTLDVIGRAGAPAQEGLSERVRLLGYVNELDDVLRTYKAMLMTRGLRGGIKTKAIHAAANGVIILAHPDAIEGTSLAHEVTALVWRDPAQLAAHLERIRSGDPRLGAIAERAREWAKANYSESVARDWWSESLARALTGRAERVRGAPPGRAAPG